MWNVIFYLNSVNRVSPMAPSVVKAPFPCYIIVYSYQYVLCSYVPITFSKYKLVSNWNIRVHRIIYYIQRNIYKTYTYIQGDSE